MSEYIECENCNLTIHKNARHKKSPYDEAGNLCYLCSTFSNSALIKAGWLPKE